MLFSSTVTATATAVKEWSPRLVTVSTGMITILAKGLEVIAVGKGYSLNIAITDSMVTERRSKHSTQLPRSSNARSRSSNKQSRQQLADQDRRQDRVPLKVSRRDATREAEVGCSP